MARDQQETDNSPLGKRRDGHAQEQMRDEVLPNADERIDERTEEIEESVRGNRGLGQARDDRGADKGETEDALKRATGGLGEDVKGSNGS